MVPLRWKSCFSRRPTNRTLWLYHAHLLKTVAPWLLMQTGQIIKHGNLSLHQNRIPPPDDIQGMRSQEKAVHREGSRRDDESVCGMQGLQGLDGCPPISHRGQYPPPQVSVQVLRGFGLADGRLLFILPQPVCSCQWAWDFAGSRDPENTRIFRKWRKTTERRPRSKNTRANLN